MLTHEDNETLVRVGRGTPMGKFMRQFWIPACLSSEVAAGGAPMRLMLLGEKLIALRDAAGRIGIMDHHCPHRRASLFFGKPEGDGIRCAYHGWKFDVTGKCLDQPNLPDTKRFPAGTPARAFRTIERGGIVYVYLGSREEPPPLPEIEALLGEADDRNVALTQRDCNWLQALEGDIDTSHTGFLHGGCIDASRMDPNDASTYTVLNKAPDIHVTQTPSGTMYSASRAAMPGFEMHRYATFIFPFWVTYPTDRLETNVTANAWVPIDDEHTMIFNIDRMRAHGQRRKTLTYADGSPIHGTSRPLEYLPRTNDWMGRWRPVPRAENDYFMDRDAQLRGESFSGITGIPLQDQAIQESMDPIVDRSEEHLGSSDTMVAVTRRVMLRAVADFTATGAVPAVLDNPGLSRHARGGDVVVPAGTDWLDAYRAALAAIHGEAPELLAT
jgi:phthalate 4,5-dioxygenase